jgi:hypothetical protein
VTNPNAKWKAVATSIYLSLSVVSQDAASRPESRLTNISINADVSAIVTQVGEWVKSGYATWQENKREAAREAVPKLVVSYISLASTLNEIAKTLEQIKYDTKKSIYLDRLLSNQMQELEDRMNVIRTQSSEIDPVWVSKNFKLATQRETMYQSRALMAEEAIDRFSSAGQARTLSATQLQEAADKLRGISDMTIKLASALAKTVAN